MLLPTNPHFLLTRTAVVDMHCQPYVVSPFLSLSLLEPTDYNDGE